MSDKLGEHKEAPLWVTWVLLVLVLSIEVAIIAGSVHEAEWVL